MHYSLAQFLFFPHFRQDLARHMASKILAEMGKKQELCQRVVQKPLLRRDKLGGGTING